MIEFRHAERSYKLEAGSFWNSSDRSDSYRDTPKGTLQEIIADVDRGVPWREAVGQRYRDANPWLHKIVCSPQRPYYFELNPPKPGAKILDIGAGWGQISLPLAKTGFVTALEPTLERAAFIRAAAAQEGRLGQMCVIQSNFQEIDFITRFDLIACIGVLEWVPKFGEGKVWDMQRDFLIQCRKALSGGGTLVVGIENRMGLKYLLGANDDHLGHPGIGCLDFAAADEAWKKKTGLSLRVATYCQDEYRRLLAEAGFSQVRFHGAYPDYKLPQVIVDAENGKGIAEYFESGGDLPEEYDGSNGGRFPRSGELNSHYRTLSALQIAHHFAPSFFIEAQC